MASSVKTRLLLDDVGCAELARDLRGALRFRMLPGSNANEAFRAAMVEMIRAIQSHGRFALLRRFIAHGSLLPSREKRFKNSPHALDDDETAKLVNFVWGHMVSKFQGALAEILAGPLLGRLLEDLCAREVLPPRVRLVPGNRIRCHPARGADTGGFHQGRVVQGPDALLVTGERSGALRVHGVAEIKSMYVSRKRLERQSRKHVRAVARGVLINGRSHEGSRLLLGSRGRSGSSVVILIYVRPSRWLLTRSFHFEPTARGRRPVMEHQELPAEASKTAIEGRNARLTLAWSHDALRAAAFSLAHRYMAEVGTSLASDPDPDVPLRQDMSAEEAGENDFLQQLHIAIFRQRDAEPDPRRRMRAIELYNVLGFGWALGHGYRDEKGRPAIMYGEDLDRLASSSVAQVTWKRGSPGMPMRSGRR